jgi:hypothetical protein
VSERDLEDAARKLDQKETARMRTQSGSTGTQGESDAGPVKSRQDPVDRTGTFLAQKACVDRFRIRRCIGWTPDKLNRIKNIKAGAGRGNRTPKGRSPADFESAASASSAIPALDSSA